jgi:hypothetical protein
MRASAPRSRTSAQSTRSSPPAICESQCVKAESSAACAIPVDLGADHDPRARFAVQVFCYRVARHIGSLAAALGGLDDIAFTAGVGENAAPGTKCNLSRATPGWGWSWTNQPTGNIRSA